MPADPRVAILHRDGSLDQYSNYAAAIPNASSANRDTVIVYADLDEPIVLKDKVDIWIYPGVIVNRSSAGVTITDDDDPVECNIYGMGIIKNTYDTGPWYECVKITNSSTKLSIECDSIEGVGGVFIDPPNYSFYGLCITVENAAKFHLTCRRVYNEKSAAIWIGKSSVVNDLNLRINSVETGLIENNNTGSSAVLVSGIGFININKIFCRNSGHCLSVRGGSITAKIGRMTSIMNYTDIIFRIAAVHLDQGSGTQKLILYFDEILNLHGETDSGIGIHHHQGTGIFIGRRVYSKDDNAIDVSGNTVKGYIKCNEIISDFLSGIRFFSNDDQITVDANVIQGYSLYGSLYAQDDANVLLKNAKLINQDVSSSSHCIVLEKTNTLLPNITLNNVKAVTGNIGNGSIIFQAGFSGISIGNYGLFANKPLDSGVTLNIGDESNYLFVESVDLT